MDFGCYGANLMTWLMDNRKPLSVVSAFQTIKPDQYEEDPQSSLQNNLIVMEILDAAKESAKTGKVIYLK